jgi:hypothetical protein
MGYHFHSPAPAEIGGRNGQFSELSQKRVVETRTFKRRLRLMSTKQIVQDLLRKLSEDVPLHDVARKIEFISAVRQGLAELDRGERCSLEEIEHELLTPQ